MDFLFCYRYFIYMFVSLLFYVEKKLRYFDLFGKSKHMLALYITQARDNG